MKKTANVEVRRNKSITQFFKPVGDAKKLVVTRAPMIKQETTDEHPDAIEISSDDASGPISISSSSSTPAYPCRSIISISTDDSIEFLGHGPIPPPAANTPCPPVTTRPQAKMLPPPLKILHDSSNIQHASGRSGPGPSPRADSGASRSANSAATSLTYGDSVQSVSMPPSSLMVSLTKEVPRDASTIASSAARLDTVDQKRKVESWLNAGRESESCAIQSSSQEEALDRAEPPSKKRKLTSSPVQPPPSSHFDSIHVPGTPPQISCGNLPRHTSIYQRTSPVGLNVLLGTAEERARKLVEEVKAKTRFVSSEPTSPAEILASPSESSDEDDFGLLVGSPTKAAAARKLLKRKSPDSPVLASHRTLPPATLSLHSVVGGQPSIALPMTLRGQQGPDTDSEADIEMEEEEEKPVLEDNEDADEIDESTHNFDIWTDGDLSSFCTKPILDVANPPWLTSLQISSIASHALEEILEAFARLPSSKSNFRWFYRLLFSLHESPTTQAALQCFPRICCVVEAIPKLQLEDLIHALMELKPDEQPVVSSRPGRKRKGTRAHETALTRLLCAVCTCLDFRLVEEHDMNRLALLLMQLALDVDISGSLYAQCRAALTKCLSALDVSELQALLHSAHGWVQVQQLSIQIRFVTVLDGSCPQEAILQRWLCWSLLTEISPHKPEFRSCPPLGDLLIMLHSQQSKFALPTGKTYGILALNAELLSLLLRRLDVYFSTSPVVLRPDGAVIDAGSARRADLDIIIDYIQQSHTRIQDMRARSIFRTKAKGRLQTLEMRLRYQSKTASERPIPKRSQNMKTWLKKSPGHS